MLIAYEIMFKLTMVKLGVQDCPLEKKQQKKQIKIHWISDKSKRSMKKNKHFL